MQPILCSQDRLTVAMHDAQRFSYRFPKTQLMLMLLVVAALPLALSFMASTNRKGLRLFGLARFSAGGATTIYWVLAVLAALAASAVAVMAIRAFRAPGYVELGATAALLPRASLAQDLITIPYGTIRNVQCVQVPGQQMIVVCSGLGEARLMAKAFASADDFTTFLRQIEARLQPAPEAWRAR